MSESPVAIVTGASSGIGRQTAILLSALNYRVALVGRRSEELSTTLGQMKEGSHSIHPIDLTHPPSTHALVGHVVDAAGRLDVLVNNAGIARVAPLADGIDEQEIRANIELNTVAPAMLIAAAWPHLLQQKRACIINLSSLATADPFPGFFAYAASKAALNAMVKSCAKEGSPGIRAFGVAPGCVETPLLRQMFDTNAISAELAIEPQTVATLIIECIEGRWDQHNGHIIAIAIQAGQDERWLLEHDQPLTPTKHDATSG